MRISDWSSDVCSSDLGARADGTAPRARQRCRTGVRRRAAEGAEPVVAACRIQQAHPAPDRAVDGDRRMIAWGRTIVFLVVFYTLSVGIVLTAPIPALIGRWQMHGYARVRARIDRWTPRCILGIRPAAERRR